MDLTNKKGLIIFVRHGQTEWNVLKRMQGREDIPLNEQGLKEAEFTAQGIKNACDKTGLVFDKVVSSPLLRASVTGEYIARAIGCKEIYCDEKITERDFGVLSGTPFDTNSKYIMRDVSEVESLEPVAKLLSRVNSFISENASPNENVLVVTHGAVTRIFADHAEKAPGYEITAPFLLNCHLVVYTYDGQTPVLQGYNIPSQELDKFLEAL